MKLKISSLALCLLSPLLFYGCSRQILEYSYVLTPKFEAKHIDGIDLMTISGLSGHSALIVKCITINKIGDEINILIYLRLSNKNPGETGNFNYTFEIPRDVNKIYFGKEKTQVWMRSPANDAK